MTNQITITIETIEEHIPEMNMFINEFRDFFERNRENYHSINTYMFHETIDEL